MNELRRLYDYWLTIPDPPGEPGLRRCAEGHLVVAPAAPCTKCGLLTAGLQLTETYTGVDELTAADFERRQKARRVVLALAGGVWAVALLRVLAYLVFDGVLSAFFVLVTTGVFALGFHLLIVQVTRLVLESLRGRASHGNHVEDLEGKLNELGTRVLEPFLDRNSLGENAPIRSPPDELHLLEQAFARAGLMPRHGTLPALLATAALRRDFRRFRERLVATGHEDRHLAYARAFPGDELLVMLEALLVEAGKDRDRCAELVRAWRSDRKLDAFLTDLDQRRTGGSVVVTVEALDGVEPESFEKLLLMVLEADGWTPHGAWLERHGEKIAFFARHQSSPVDTSAVQEALVAKARLSCDGALVATNAAFTDAAHDFAKSNKVELVDRPALERRLASFNKSPKDYGRLAALLKPRAP